jgi:hypothetical protein
MDTVFDPFYHDELDRVSRQLPITRVVAYIWSLLLHSGFRKQKNELLEQMRTE